MNIGRRCGVTGKVIFKSHKAALIRAGEILEQESNRKKCPTSWRTYQCEYCGFYHITSKISDFTPNQDQYVQRS